MFLYLLKFSFCLAIFLAFYKLFLEKENIHFFKRFYLLIAIVLAFSIPLITFTTYIEPIAVTPLEFGSSITFNDVTTEALVQPSSSNYWLAILWSMYALGVILFGIKFIKNLFTLIYKIKRNPKYKKTSEITNVLLKDDVTPHTFLRYIFFNKYKFETQKIPQEVFWHEETHAKQKHSIDVLIIEFLQVIFWFNPLIYFTKRAIKLNHEFLADQGVLNRGIVPSTYQQIVLTFSAKKPESDLANAINYSSIKKRFTIMKTQTSKRAFWLRSITLLPLLAFTLYGFSNKIEVEKAISKNDKAEHIKNDLINDNSLNTVQFDEVTLEKNEKSKDNFLIYINHKGQYIVNREALTLQSIKNKISTLSKKELNLRVKYSSPIKKIKDAIELLNSIKGLKVNPTIYHQAKEDISSKKAKEINALLDSIGELEIISINIPTPKLVVEYEDVKFKLINDIKNKQQNLKKSSFQEKASPEQITDYNVWAKELQNAIIEASKKDRHVGIIKTKVLEKYKHIYSIMTPKQRVNAVDFPDYTVPVITTIKQGKEYQDKATPKQVKEYNKLAKYYNNLPKDNLLIKLKDMSRIRELYNLMSDTQKKNAEPFPNFPPPSPPLRPSEKNSKKYASKPLKGIPLPKLSKNPTQQEKRAYNKALEEYKNQGYGYTYKYKNNNGKIVDVTVITSDVAPPPPPVVKRPPPPPQIIKQNKNEPNPLKVPEPPQVIEVREIKKNSKLPKVIEIKEVKKSSKLPEPPQVIEVREIKKNSKLPKVIEIKEVKKDSKLSEKVIKAYEEKAKKEKN